MLSLQGCSDDSIPFTPVTPGANLTALDTAYAIGARANVFMFTDAMPLKTGYNKIYFVLYDSVTGTLITDAHIEMEPANHGTTLHVENPPQNAVNGVFEGAVIFDAAQTDNPRHVHFHVHVHNHQAPGEPEGEAEFSGLTIESNPAKFLKYYTLPDSTLYLFSYIKPKAPVTGQNDFEFLVSKKVNTAFTADGTFNVQVKPVLQPGITPSTGNTDPTASSDGHYKGRINLTSAGTWKVNLHFSNTVVTDSVYFELTY
jgi:hypothetical protein